MPINDETGEWYDDGSGAPNLTNWGTSPNVDYSWGPDETGYTGLRGTYGDQPGDFPMPEKGTEPTGNWWEKAEPSGVSGLLKTFGQYLSGDKKIGGEDGLGIKQLLSMYMMSKLLTGGKSFRTADIGGYNKGIPNLTATQTAIKQPAYVPYSGKAVMGSKQLSDVTYTPRAAQGGIMGLAAGGLRNGSFIIPADVVSHFGNGSSEAGMEFLAKKLGATPIKGAGDGMSDSIDTTIDGKQPAKVAHEEAIVSPEKVAALGKGDPKKGAKTLYAMMDRVRKARTGTKKQGKQIKPEKFMPGGIASLAGGGAVAFAEGDLVKSTPAGSSTTSNLSEWAGPYVTDMLGKTQALAGQKYQAYQGPLTAGYSPLQQQAFTGYQNYQAPAAIGQAAQTAGNIAGQFGKTKYVPTQFGNQFTAPGAYQTGQFNTGLGPVGSVQSYMNPYLQGVTDIEAREARRQADITGMAQQAKMAQAGAFGGSRDAIMRAELARNLGTQIGDITSRGLNTAYDKALAQRLAEAGLGLQAQQYKEASRQFGAGQGMTAAQLRAQYSLSAQQAAEQSKQFGAKFGLEGLQGALQAAQTQGNLGVQQGQLGLQALQGQLGAGEQQRAIEQQGITARQAEFDKQRLYPYQQLEFQQKMLQGLPVSTYSNTPNTSGYQDLLDFIAQVQATGKSAAGD